MGSDCKLIIPYADQWQHADAAFIAAVFDTVRDYDCFNAIKALPSAELPGAILDTRSLYKGPIGIPALKRDMSEMPLRAYAAGEVASVLTKYFADDADMRPVIAYIAAMDPQDPVVPWWC